MPIFMLHTDDLSEKHHSIEVVHEAMLPAPQEGMAWTEIPGPLGKWTLDVVDGQIVPVLIVNAAVARLERLADLAALRWEKMQTFTYEGQSTWADAAVRNITSKLQALKEREARGEQSPSIMWKLGDGVFVEFDIQALTDFGLAVDAHIQACFDREAKLAGLILAAADPASVDIATGWPG